jgi:hypothetical protein
MAQISDALVCRNMHLLRSVTFTPGLDFEGNARMMLGLPLPRTRTWSYDAASDTLRDEFGEVSCAASLQATSKERLLALCVLYF